LPIYKEIRTYNLAKQLTNVALETPTASFYKDYKYNDNLLVETTSNFKSLNPYHPVYFDKKVIVYSEKNRAIKLMIEKDNYPTSGNNFSHIIQFEYDIKGNIRTRFIIETKTNSILAKSYFEYDNNPNPLYRNLQADAFYSTFCPINMDVFYYSKNNVIKATQTWPSAKSRYYSVNYHYDDKSRPIRADIINDGYPDFSDNIIEYQYLH
jgi:hypothetical protein